LAALVGATTPDMRGRFPIGDNATLTLLGTGGSLTITANNLPAHSHPNTASASTSVSVSDPGHSHTIDTFDVATGGSAMGSPEPGYGASAGDEANVVNSNTTGITASATTTVTMTNANNTTTASDYYPPHLVVNYIIKHD
jgi:microcystin-dependent protein